MKSEFYLKYLSDINLDCYLWIADYLKEPNHIPWKIWQHSEKSKFKGINGYCDRNVFKGNSEDFKLLLLK